MLCVKIYLDTQARYYCYASWHGLIKLNDRLQRTICYSAGTCDVMFVLDVWSIQWSTCVLFLVLLLQCIKLMIFTRKGYRPATVWSCSSEPPLTLIAPTTLPFRLSGIPPAKIMIRPSFEAWIPKNCPPATDMVSGVWERPPYPSCCGTYVCKRDECH